MFPRRLIRDTDRKLFMIGDNPRVHRAKVVMAWMTGNADRIELFYPPPYARESNPDEHVKQGMVQRRTPMDKAAMKALLKSHMYGLQRRPHKVRAFFQAPNARYAA
jgi:hypothetical protein